MNDQAEASAPMSAGLNIKLSVMMFLQYGIWGAWLPILFPYLMGHIGFSLNQVAYIFMVGAVGAIVGPFIAGQVADRHFATEKFLAASHLAGAILVWFLSTATGFWPFLVLSLLYGLIYAPTLALTNSLAFHHMPDRDRDFGKIRVWGTIGWIAAGVGFGHFLGIFHTPEGTSEEVQAAWNAARAHAFQLSAILGVFMAGYCLTLPHTPPTESSEEGKKNAALEALGEIKVQPLVTLFLLAVPVSMIHQFYFVHTAQFLSVLEGNAAADKLGSAINKVLGVGGGGLMTLGQMTEIAVLAGIPFVAKKISRKGLLAIGLVAYAARMALFAYAPTMVPILVGVALHGFCFGCFIFVAFMVVDEETTADVKASAQNLFNLVIIGIGIIVGSWFAIYLIGGWAMEPVLDEAGKIVLDADGKETSAMNYTKLFSVPMWMSIACLAILLIAYPGGRRQPALAATGNDSVGEK